MRRGSADADDARQREDDQQHTAPPYRVAERDQHDGADGSRRTDGLARRTAATTRDPTVAAGLRRSGTSAAATTPPRRCSRALAHTNRTLSPRRAQRTPASPRPVQRVPRRSRRASSWSIRSRRRGDSHRRSPGATYPRSPRRPRPRVPQAQRAAPGAPAAPEMRGPPATASATSRRVAHSCRTCPGFAPPRHLVRGASADRLFTRRTMPPATPRAARSRPAGR